MIKNETKVQSTKTIIGNGFRCDAPFKLASIIFYKYCATLLLFVTSVITLTRLKTSLKLIFLFLLSNLLFSQTILRGHVRDTLGSPIPFANVLTLQNDSAVVVAFGIADGAGYYTFKTPSTPAVRFRSLILSVNDS